MGSREGVGMSGLDSCPHITSFQFACSKCLTTENLVKETKEQKATLAELIYRSQKGEEIEVYVTDDLDEIVSPVEVFDFKKWLEHHEWNSKDLLKPQTFKYRIKPRTVTITREQLAEVYGSEYGISTDILLDTNAKGSFVNICKKLGLSHD